MEHLSNASNSLESCRAVLRQQGQNDAANIIQGLQLLDPESALTARGILGSTPVFGDDAHAAKAEAMNALHMASREQRRAS